MTIQKYYDLASLVDGATATTALVHCDLMDGSGTAVGDMPGSGHGINGLPAMKITDRKMVVTNSSVTWGRDEWAMFPFYALANPSKLTAVNRFNAGVDGSSQADVSLDTDGKMRLRLGSTLLEKGTYVFPSGTLTPYWVVHHLDQDGAFQEAIFFDWALNLVDHLTDTCGSSQVIESRQGLCSSATTAVLWVGPITIADEALGPTIPTIGIIAQYDFAGTTGDDVTDTAEGADAIAGGGTMKYLPGVPGPDVDDPSVEVIGTRFLTRTPDPVDFPDGVFPGTTWTRFPLVMRQMDDNAITLALRDAGDVIQGGVSLSPDGRVRLRMDTGFSAASVDTYPTNPGMWANYKIDAAKGRQTCQLVSRRGRIMETVQGECLTDPVTQHEYGSQTDTGTVKLGLGVMTFADEPLAVPVAFGPVYALNGVASHLAASVTFRVTGGQRARLIVPDGITCTPAEIVLADPFEMRFELTREAGTTLNDHVDWMLQVQIDIGGEYEDVQAGSFDFLLPPGQPGRRINGYVGCLASKNTGHNPAWYSIATKGCTTIKITGDFHYQNLTDSASVQDHLDAEEHVFDEFPEMRDLLCTVDAKRDNSDHDGGGASNSYFHGVCIDRFYTAYGRVWPHHMLAELAADSCKFESWIDGRTCHIKVDTRSNGRSDPFAADTDDKTCLGLAQRAIVLDLLNNPPEGVVGFVFDTDMGWLGDGELEVGGLKMRDKKADAWASYPNERAIIGAAMLGKRGTIKQGDWHTLIMDDGAGSVGGWQVLGDAGMIRSTGNLNIFSEWLPPSIQVWPPYDEAADKYPSQHIEIYGILEINDTGDTYSHTIRGWDSLAETVRLERTQMWDDVPAAQLDRRWVLDNIDLTGLAHNVKKRDAGLVMAGMRGDNVTIPTMPGTDWTYGKVWDEVTFALQMWVLGLNDDGTATSDRQTALLNQLHELSLHSRSSRLMELLRIDGSDVWQAWVEQVAEVRMSTMDQADGAEFVLPLKCPAGIWQDRAVTTQTLPWDQPTQVLTFDAFAGATAPLHDAILTITHRLVNPQLNDGNSANFVQYVDTNGAFETTTINCATFDCDKDGVDVEGKIRYPGMGPLLMLWPGRLGYVIRAVADEPPGAGCEVTLSGRRKRWITAMQAAA